MKKLFPIGAMVAVVAAVAFAGGDKPKPCVAFAKSWEAACAEAKLLCCPIVLHSHGFN